MPRISSEFCIWMRNLPGEDMSINETSEDTISALFDTGVSANPGTSAIGEGLKSWAKFGSSVTGTDRAKKDLQSAYDLTTRRGKLNDKNYVEKLLGGSVSLKNTSTRTKSKEYDLSAHHSRKLYGVWYQDPKNWNDYLNHQKEQKVSPVDTGKWSTASENLRAELPGQVNMMGGQQPVAQLHSTLAFDKYLTEMDNYKKPSFLQHIFKTQA